MTNLLTRGKRRGQGIIEFAVILPLFLLLVGGVVDFGLFMFQREEAASCTREVARRAAVRVAPAVVSADVPQCDRVNDLGELDLPPGYLDLDGGESVTVGIDYPYDPIFLDAVIPMNRGSPISLDVTASVTMRMEAGQ
jgi:hypothetical protein